MSFCLIRHFLKRVLNYCVTFSNESLHLFVLPHPLRETNPIPCTFFQVLEGNLNLVVELIEWQTEAVSAHTAICSDTTGDDHIDTAIMR